MTHDDTRRLVAAAQELLRDERHWSLVDCADRAEAGRALAELILSALGAPMDDCPEPCGACKAHKANCGEE